MWTLIIKKIEDHGEHLSRNAGDSPVLECKETQKGFINFDVPA